MCWTLGGATGVLSFTSNSQIVGVQVSTKGGLEEVSQIPKPTLGRRTWLGSRMLVSTKGDLEEVVCSPALVNGCDHRVCPRVTQFTSARQRSACPHPTIRGPTFYPKVNWETKFVRECRDHVQEPVTLWWAEAKGRWWHARGLLCHNAL